MLKVQDLHVYYGGIHALKGISIEVPQGKDRHPDRRATAPERAAPCGPSPG